MIKIIKEFTTKTIITYTIPISEIEKVTGRKYRIEYERMLRGYHLMYVDDEFVLLDFEKKDGYIDEIIYAFEELATLDDFKGDVSLDFAIDQDGQSCFIYSFERSSTEKTVIKQLKGRG